MYDIIKYLKKIKCASYFKVLLYVLLIAVTYQTALKYLIFSDWSKEDYSHCYLIPFVILYLIWEKRSALSVIPSSPSWKGLMPFIFGLFLFWLGELGGEFFTLYLSLWFVIIGLVWLHFGWQKMKTIAFALIMILAMFPLPKFLNVQLTLTLKLISSKLGVWILHLFGISAFREGNIIDLGFTTLQIVDACSGLRYVMPLMVLSLILAYWFKAHLWKRILLFLSSVPLAVFINSFRIAMTGILYSAFGASVADGFFHDFEGWIIFLVAISFLLFEMWVLKRGFKVQGSEFKVGEKEVRSEVQVSKFKVKEGKARLKSESSQLKGKSSLLSPMFIITLSILLLTFGISQMVSFRKKVPVKKSLSEFPLFIGEWTGARQFMDKEFIDQLDLSEYIMVVYRNTQGRDIDFYIAYNESQSKGKATHSPETCLPASGWSFEQAGLAGILTDDGITIKVNRAIMKKNGNRELAYFWFPQRGRILTNLYQVKFYSFWDALTIHRTDGALVRLITPLYPQESMGDAEARLQGFTKLIFPLLDEFLPER